MVLQITLESMLVHHVDARREANDLSAPLPVRPTRTIFQHGKLLCANLLVSMQNHYCIDLNTHE